MATLAGESSPSPTLSGTGSMDEPSHSVNIRKRLRETCDDSFDDGQWDLTDDGRPKTRRVNPQRLAIRLGPELVAEMEALIVPGAKMPTFTVRKDFQERYNVDRRHIYDYFHSRGLRVAKEDKHTNLIRGRAMKAQALAQAQAQLAQIQALSQPTCSPMVKQESTQDGGTLLTRPFLTEAVTSPAKPPGRVIKRTLKAQDKKPRVSTGRRPGRLPKALKAAREKSDMLTLPSSADTPESVPAMTSSGTDTEWESMTLVYPKFAPSDDPSSIKIKRDTGDVSDFLVSPDEFVAGYFDSSSDDTQQSFLDMECSLTCDSLDLDSLMTVDEHRLLTPEERNELYDLIDNNIPRATSFEESALVYNDYMNGHLLPYFDSIPSNYHTSTRSNWKSVGLTSNYPSPDVDYPISLDIPDLRKWLSDDHEMHHLSMYAREYNPTVDEMKDNHVLSGIIAREPFSTTLGQAQNKTVLGKVQKPAEEANKQVGYMRAPLMSAAENGVGQTLQHQDENVNPCGT